MYVSYQKSAYKLRNEVGLVPWIFQKTCDSWIGNPGCITQGVIGNVDFFSIDLAPKLSTFGAVHGVGLYQS